MTGPTAAGTASTGRREERDHQPGYHDALCVRSAEEYAGLKERPREKDAHDHGHHTDRHLARSETEPKHGCPDDRQDHHVDPKFDPIGPVAPLQEGVPGEEVFEHEPGRQEPQQEGNPSSRGDHHGAQHGAGEPERYPEPVRDLPDPDV